LSINNKKIKKIELLSLQLNYSINFFLIIKYFNNLIQFTTNILFTKNKFRRKKACIL